MSSAKKIAFLGLGVMGGPMAGHLARAGHEVTLYNRTPERAQARADLLAADGIPAQIAATPAEAAEGQDVVLTCVGNDADLAQVVLGPDGALAAMRPGSLFIDHTTVSADIARRIVDAVRQPTIAAGRTAAVTASVGIAPAGESLTATGLLREADGAMYRAKALGRDQTSV